MKKTVFVFALFCSIAGSFASDLNFLVVNETSGMSNGSVDLTVTGGVSPFTYAWSGPSSFTATTEDISGLITGMYMVTVTDKYCGVATYTVLVDVSSGLNEKEKPLTLLVYPNPGSNLITLSAGSPLKTASLRILNLEGKTVMERNNLYGDTFIFDVSQQATGIYFIEIKNNGTLTRTRFVKN